jgi:hypothetical protein
VTQIARLEDVRNTLYERFVPVGTEYGVTKEFAWKTIETTFKTRIMTGAVINSSYIKPRQFLVEIRNIVIKRIHSVMAEYGSVKINTGFDGKFIAGDKTAIKTIAAKNRELFPTSDMHEWYTKYVVDSLTPFWHLWRSFKNTTADGRCHVSWT